MASGSEIAAAAAMNATLAVERVAGRSDNEMNQIAVGNAAPEIAQAIKVAIDTTPEMQHVLNTEHWWQKRSRWAFIIGIITTLGGPALSATGVEIDEPTKKFIVDTLTTLGGIVASGLALWAGIAKTPLGSKPTRLPFPLNKG